MTLFRRYTITAWLCLCVASLACVAASVPDAVAADAERGSLGFAIEVDGEGFFLNPTLKTVTITSVVAGSPAAAAGIVVGDRIVEADGHTIAGAKGRDLAPLMQKHVGDSLRLRLKRADGAEYAVTLVAVARQVNP